MNLKKAAEFAVRYGRHAPGFLGRVLGFYVYDPVHGEQENHYNLLEMIENLFLDFDEKGVIEFLSGWASEKEKFLEK